MIKNITKNSTCNGCGLSLTVIRDKNDHIWIETKWCPQCQKTTIHTEKESIDEVRTKMF